MNTRIEIFRDGLWRQIKLRNNKAIKYNAVINKMGTISSRDISHTNTFELPDVHQNRVALGINTFNKSDLAKVLNSKFLAKYYIKNKITQEGYLIINNTQDGISVNFIDSALDITEKWGAVTFNELLSDPSFDKPTDYLSAISEMEEYVMDKENPLPQLSLIDNRSYPLALYPNSLNAIGDKFQVSHIVQPDGGIEDLRLDDSFNPYQSRPVFNAKALFDLATRTFGYTPIFDPSVDWGTMEKTYLIDSGLDQNKKKDDGQLSVTYPTVELFENTSPPRRWIWTSLYENAFTYAPDNNTQVFKPEDASQYWRPPFDVPAPGFEEFTDDYLQWPCLFLPRFDGAIVGELDWKMDLSQTHIRFNSNTQQIEEIPHEIKIYAIWENIIPSNGTVSIEMDILENNSIPKKVDISIDKSQIKSREPVDAGAFLGVILFTKAYRVYPGEESTNETYNNKLVEKFLPENVVTYDEDGQYVADEINLTHAAPRTPIQKLLGGLMHKEGILMSISNVGGVKSIKYFSYGAYETAKKNGIFEDWSKYHQDYSIPTYNTDYGNNYAKINEIGLTSPYVGNTHKIILNNQGEDSKYKEYTKNTISSYRDISKIDSIENTLVPYFEYTNKGLGLVEDTLIRLNGLNQITADGQTQGLIEDLPSIANVNLAVLPLGVEEWYNLVDRAVRVSSKFLLPTEVIRNLDLSIPIFVEKLGGYYIIEEVPEYVDDNTIVEVDLIKLIDDISVPTQPPNQVVEIVAKQGWESNYKSTVNNLIDGVDMQGNQSWSSSYQAQLISEEIKKEILGLQLWDSVYSANIFVDITPVEIQGNQSWSSIYTSQLTIGKICDLTTFGNIDGGSAISKFLPQQNISGGSATSIPSFKVGGGNAFNE